MYFLDLLKEKQITIYQLSKKSNIPYMTLNDICNGKVRLEKCKAETVFKIAQVLEVSMEELLRPYMYERTSFENFKSNVCHQLKNLGDVNFIISVLETNNIEFYFEQQWYPESFYLLGMLDYISRINMIPLCADYNHLRSLRLEKTLYPESLRALSIATNDEKVLLDAERNAIPEFKRFNIVENEVRNVI